MNFLKTISNEALIILLILVLFLFTFFVFSLPMTPFLLALAIIVFVFAIYAFYRYISYQKHQRLEEQVEELEQSLHNVRNEQIEYKKEVEAYFLTWVHQMKTPITASKLLLARNEEGMVNQLRQEILQIDNYSNLALSYLKLLNHNTDMVLAPVTIDELIRPLIKKYSIQFIENQTKIHYEKSTAKVITDARWCSIMIEQLLNNALKYARGQDIWINYNENEQKLEIRDNGIGISRADLPKIFDQGYSGYNGRLHEKSSGIGLFIVKRVSKHLNHSVEVESELGEGARFTIQIPNSGTERE
ncbi:sensor histidine kinase [Staphylococcus pettenkoferi]|uniref:sensor histidine kinase n=1 Tax=Staphylococcus pettenkoferi TaxID=170573 RepID=UPI00066E456F|nr:sensor histidine kinase [Staphylococcus pettenkoferi]MCY1567408.1 sensor histidine kinase [Staphylococcus pettenkoferi]MCY1588265.1 sensor histidine kinase [Staphylococcus pettenkoferi]MDK7115317.1 sensor histidine kinase [Staphylococcus pettenkoferi]MDK7283635.1 sensor histidine kinase [Staphylococcus pettenkoferi]